jgi:hypothetical protein
MPVTTAFFYNSDLPAGQAFTDAVVTPTTLTERVKNADLRIIAPQT